MRFLRYIPVLVLFLFLTLNLSGQGEANHWYFGNLAGLDFNPGAPVPLNNGALATGEGCASISDASGNLLFYTDGTTVWNANHQVMQNGTGLFGNSSSTQSAIIVPRPNHPGIYYIFTTPAVWGSNGGLRYSEVDMSLQSGLGAITTNKNILISVAPLTEKLTAIANASGTGYWVLSPISGLTVRAFEVTAAGVNLTPVNSTVGGLVHIVGQLKASPDGQWLAWGGFTNGGTIAPPRIAKFNTATGQITSDTVLANTGLYTYGVEFSANSSFLYLNSMIANFLVSTLLQFDLSSNSFAAINNSTVTVATLPSVYSRSLQLGPDKKIYSAKQGFQSLDVINFPDSAGLACGFQSAGQPLSMGTSSVWGLPAFIQSTFFSNLYTWEDTCANDSTQFFASGPRSDSVWWDFGDPASGPANAALGDTVSHVFSTHGTFSVVTSSYWFNSTGFVSYLDSIIDTLTVTIHPYPEIDLGSDTILCEGDSINITNSNTSLVMDYLWSDSSTALSMPIFEADTYHVEVSTVCGVAYDTIVIDSVIPALVNLGPDSTFCNGDTVIFELNLPLAQYVWHDNDTSSSYHATSTGWYSVTASSVCNTHHDSVYFSFVAPPVTNMPDDTVFCTGNSTTFEVTADSVSILWQDSSTLNTFLAAQPDTYSVMVTGPCGVLFDSTIVLIDNPLDIFLGNDTVLCEGITHWFPSNTPERVTLFWSDSTTVDSFYIDEPLTLWLGGLNTCNADTDTLVVHYEVPPAISLPREALLCSGETFDADVTFSRSQYQWSHGLQSGLVSLAVEGNYAVTVTNLCGQDTAAMKLLVDYPLSIDLGGPYDICEGDTIYLDVTAPNSPVYKWNNNASVPQMTVTKADFLEVTVTNSCGSYHGETAVYLKDKPTSSLPLDTVICGAAPWNVGLIRNHQDVMWFDGTSAPSLAIDSSGTYWLSMKNDCGWSTDSFHVKFTSPPVMDLGVDTFVCPSISSVMLDAGEHDGVLYLWQDGQRASTYEVTEAGNYSVTISNEDGCAFDDQVWVGDCPVLIWIPAAFSPNSDQLNDVFLPQLDYVTDFHMTIFDRWGNQLFETKNQSEGWDGMTASGPLPGGAYSWLIRFQSDQIGAQQVRGTITLLK